LTDLKWSMSSNSSESGLPRCEASSNSVVKWLVTADVEDWIRAFASQQGAWANIPPKRNRKDPICFSPYLYRARNLVERFFNKIKQCRRIATRYDKLAARRASSSLTLAATSSTTRTRAVMASLPCLANKLPDGLDKTRNRDRLGDVGFAAPFADTLLISLHGEGGHRDHRNLPELIVLLQPFGHLEA